MSLNQLSAEGDALALADYGQCSVSRFFHLGAGIECLALADFFYLHFGSSGAEGQ